MKIVMVDDSEQKNCRRARLGYLVGAAAVVFPEEGLSSYSDGIRMLRQEFGVPPETELKWSPDDGSWLKTEAGNAARTIIRRRMLSLGVEVGATSLTVILDRTRLNWSIVDARQAVLRYLYDKVSTCLRMQRGSPIGMIVADEPGGGPANQKSWLAETQRLTEEGTAWTKPEQIVLPIVTATSHHVPHLQLADLVVGATVAAVAGNEYAIDLLPDLMSLAHSGIERQIGGVGLTLWPPDLDNLYHHVCGDTHRWKQNVGVKLPNTAWEYFANDGLSA